MSGVELFDPLDGLAAGWPAGAVQERAYIEAFARQGSQALIANLRTTVMGARVGDLILPVTANEAEYGDAYVCLPHSAYSLYAKAELGLVDAGPWTPALAGLADAAGWVMRAAQLNQVVHLDNWLLSTNLHGAWDGEGVEAIGELLRARFPDHLLAVRSLTEWADGPLIARLRAAGWRLLPARRIYVTDDLPAEWAPKINTRRDLALLARSGLRRDDFETLGEADAVRIAELYALLYLDRYSALNPAFTAAYIAMTHACGLIQYRGLRDAEGELVSVVGCLARGGVLTTPIVGYDTSRPQAQGLYRLASVLLAQEAAKRGLRLNGSAGAADFKRVRGARGVTEYTAYDVDHLSRRRRAVVSALSAVLDRIALPLMVERGL